MRINRKNPDFSPKPHRLIEGRNPVLEALKANTEIFELLIEEGIRHDEKINKIFSLSVKKQLPKRRFSRRKLDRISETKVHQGVIAKAAILEPPTISQIINNCYEKGKSPFFVVLPEVEYVQNLGAVMRTAEIFGANAVIISKREMEINAVVSRTSMGATEYIPLIHENLFTAFRIFKKEDIKIVAAETDSKKSLFEVDLSGPLALVIGGEHKSISETILKKVDERVYIPMFGQISSLNLSVAAGVLMYEVTRQRELTCHPGAKR